jgi:hypothetical protein
MDAVSFICGLQLLKRPYHVCGQSGIGLRADFFRVAPASLPVLFLVLRLGR